MRKNELVVTADGLSKSYMIGHQSATAGGRESLREAIGRSATNLARKMVHLVRGRQTGQRNEIEEFWALRDVSFEIKGGEVLGIIGRNGAGKSTLLKILSRITEPTKGRATIKGRVASLLEVGTGFHQDLTGRENIFLNGAILGMSRAEIRSRFDEIVNFAEIEQFLDTPVKRYSSGMYVRLAFAVAAHLEPDILIIDEVLAVGDVVFQKKCLGKMHHVAQGGRTVIFVSHNLPAIVGLTSRALWLDKGRCVMDGASSEVVSCFLRSTETQLRTSGDVSAYRRPYRMEGYVEITSVKVCGEEPGGACLKPGDALIVDIGLKVERPVDQAIVVINVLNEQLEILASLCSMDSEFSIPLDVGLHTVRCNMGTLPLVPRDYHLTIGVSQPHGALAWDVLESIPGFRVEAAQRPAWLQSADRPGVLLVDGSKWSVVYQEAPHRHSGETLSQKLTR